GLDAAAAVACGARHRAGGPRSDAQVSAGAKGGDAAAADADGVDVDLADLDRKRADATLRGHAIGAAAHEADVGRGTPHVAGDEIGIAGGGAPAASGDR